MPAVRHLYFHFYFVGMSVLPVCVSVLCSCSSQKKDIISGVSHACALPYGCWELGLLEYQSGLLTAKQSLQPHVFLLKIFYFLFKT